MDGQIDPRARRTRDAIVGALIERVFRQRYDAIRTGDLIAAAGVGRSTFYAHFRSKDAVLLAAMEPILLPLANAAAGRASAAQVRSTLAHVWEQRSLARVILGSAASVKLQRRLADDRGGDRTARRRRAAGDARDGRRCRATHHAAYVGGRRGVPRRGPGIADDGMCTARRGTSLVAQ